ncbi:MAG: TIGR02444 family protein [Geminicoccaceae bacterium]
MTSSGETWPKSAFWTYSLDLYGRPDVKEACLALQDRRGHDVNLLLFAVWLSTLGIALDRSSAALAEDAVQDLRGRVVQPLRAVRRHLRTASSTSPSMTEDWSVERQRLGDRVAAAELDGEHLCQLALDRLSAGLNAGQPPGAALAAANLARLASFEHDDRTDVQALLQAAYPGLSPETMAEALRRLVPA